MANVQIINGKRLILLFGFIFIGTVSPRTACGAFKLDANLCVNF